VADTKISALTSGNPAQSGDEIPIARAGANYKITAGSIASLATVSPAGSDTYVQFNDGGAFGAEAGFAYNKTTNTLASEKLALGTAGAATGVLTLSGSTSGTVTLQPAAAAGTYTLTLPTSDGNSGEVLTTDGTGVLSWAARIESFAVAASDETTALTTGTAKVTFRMPYAFTLSAVRASVTTAPTGATLTVDINESGTSILSTKLTIDAGEKTSTTAATPPVISDSALADDAEITIDIDQIGSTVAGAGLKVYLIGTRA